MLALSAEWQAYLAQPVTALATIWKLTRQDGVVMGFTDADEDLVIEGVTYEADSGFGRSALQNTLDLSVPNMEITGALSSDRITEADIAGGLYDHAVVDVYVVAVDRLGDLPPIHKSRGVLGNVSIMDYGISAEWAGLTRLLSRSALEVYTPDCRARLGDKRCKVGLAAWTETGAVTSVTDRRVFTATLSDYPGDAWFNGGKIVWTNGANTGFTMEVKSYSQPDLGEPTIALFLPMPFDVQDGDTFEIVRGCDGLLETCINVFDNAANFRGEPFVPTVDEYSRGQL